MDKPFAIVLDVGSSLANETGAWRTNRPVYLDRLPPCNNACPAGEVVTTSIVRPVSASTRRSRCARIRWPRPSATAR
jgi:hypothetical protein